MPPAAPESDDPIAVEAFFAASTHPLSALARELHDLILTAVPGLTSGIKWNAPSFYCGEWFATFHLRRPTEVQIVLHCGVKVRPTPSSRYVEDPSKLLTWKTNDRAVAAFTATSDLRERKPHLLTIVRAWVQHLRDDGIA